MTSAIPAASVSVGTWVSTSRPITVAVAGSSETISEYAARLSCFIATWSAMYGITELEMPTPMPAAIATGSVNAGIAAQPAIGVTNTSATIIAAASPSIDASPATRCASTM